MACNATGVKRQRYRQQWRFWLDMSLDDERSLADYLESAKQNRKFHHVLREALRLWIDLERGGLDALERQFPHALGKSASASYEELLQAIHAIQAQPVMRDTPAVTLDVGEVELDIKAAEYDPDAARRVTQNFFNSLMAVQEFPTAPPSRPSRMKTKPKPPQGGPKAMDVPTFDAPDFDDMEL